MSNFQDSHFLPISEPWLDFFFPCIAFLPCFLFGPNMLALKCRVWPPPLTLTICMNRFGEKLVWIARESVGVDGADTNRPVPSATGLIAQVGCLICRPDKDGLPRLNQFLSAIWWPIALILP